MSDQPESTGISVHGTELSEEETAALLAVITTQLVDTVPATLTPDHSTRHRVSSTWADFATWQNLPRGH